MTGPESPLGKLWLPRGVRSQDLSADVKNDLIHKIRREGPITFADFMHNSLYGKYGFYSTGKAASGTTYREGYHKGFLSNRTTPEQTPIFARIFAVQLPYIWDQIGCPERFDFVEMGAGTGGFAKELLAISKKDFPEFPGFAEVLRYTIVEISPALLKLQRRVLAGERVNFVLGSVVKLPLKDIQGVFFSNELVDSFPVHRVKLVNGKLREIFVGVRDGKLVEAEGDASTPHLSDYLEEGNIQLREGEEAWINLNALSWIRRVAAALKRGYVVTIDYGDSSEELYRQLTILYELFIDQSISSLVNPGMNDLTAPVDFSAIENEGRKFGLETQEFIDRSEYFANLGLYEMIEDQLKKLSPEPQVRSNTLRLIDQARNLLKMKGWKILIQRNFQPQTTE